MLTEAVINLPDNNVLEKCPLGKRYDFEQIIKYALNLAREKDNEDCNL